jgi:mycothiol synthase
MSISTTLALRPFDIERDIPAQLDIINACNTHGGFEAEVSEGELRNDWLHAVNCAPAEDCVMAEADGVPAGFGSISWRLNDEQAQLFYLDGGVHPRFQRRGIGAAILAWQEQRVAQVAAATAATAYAGPRLLQASAFESDQGFLALLRRNGYDVARYTFLMLRDLTQPAPDLPIAPGLSVRPPAPGELRHVLEGRNEAFRDHWNHREWTDADYQRTASDPLARPEWWQVAWDDASGEPAGAVHVYVYDADNARFGIKRGWADQVWVRRPWRKRGLARALLARTFEQLRGMGMTEAALFVDAQNLSGALGLYAGMGFREHRRVMTHRKSMRAED